MISVHSLLKKHHILPKKRLGQHFLAQSPTIAKIVDSLGAGKDDTVLEIGCGLGVMTHLIAQKCRHVIAVEKDASLLSAAQEEFGHIGNILWLNTDILDLEMGRFKDLKVIGNLPYNISTPIIFYLIEWRRNISRAVIMVQKEVALRLTARPHSKDYGIPSVILQAAAGCERLFDVSRRNFVPPPEVLSSVVRIDFKKGDCGIADEELFVGLVRAAFAKRRKTVENSLLSARGLNLKRGALEGALLAAGIALRSRAEDISPQQFVSLCNSLLDKMAGTK